MRYLLLLLLILGQFSLSAQTASIQNSPPLSQAKNPEAEGMSSERLAKLDKMFEEAIEKQEIPGAVALIARNGKIVYHKSFGMVDNEAGRKAQNDDIFRIASLTKRRTGVVLFCRWLKALLVHVDIARLEILYVAARGCWSCSAFV